MSKAERKTRKKAPKLKDAKAKSKQKKAKPKQRKDKSRRKVEKQSTLMPRCRLEPRLESPRKNKKSKVKVVDVEKDKRLVVSLEKIEISGNALNMDVEEEVLAHSPVENETHEVSDSLSTSSIGRSCTQTANSPQSVDAEDDEDSNQAVPKKSNRPLVPTDVLYNDREFKTVVQSLQSHGFSDLKKIAEIVKTKKENDIREFLRHRTRYAREGRFDRPRNPPGRPKNKWNSINPENLKSWPNVRKWRRMASDQLIVYTRRKDYSKPVITSLCKKFYEEEPEPSDPQVINVKLIYKYLTDCMAGEVPPQLPPKESALVLDLLREVRLMPMVYDFDEEKKFLQEFKAATTFKPFEVKDEFKKRIKKEAGEEEEVHKPNTVSVPEEIFMDLSRHKKLVQSMNPLITPVWMLQKEQEALEKYYEEPNVYVD